MLERLWNLAYCRWHDHAQAGHAVRAALWGAVADTTLAIAG